MRQIFSWLIILTSLVLTTSSQAAEPPSSLLDSDGRSSAVVSSPAILSPPAEGAPGNFHLNLAWQWTILGTGIGDSGMVLADLEGDGTLEIIAGASTDSFGFGRNDYWYVLRWNGLLYEPIWSTLPYQQTIEALTVAQVDQDPALEVLVAVGRDVMIYDGETHALQKILIIGLTPKDLVAGDLDGDGQFEIAVCSLADVHTYSVATGARELTLPGFGGVAMALGQVDDDAALEVGITRNSNIARVVDGATGAVDWAVTSGLGYAIAFGDLNRDGYDEVVGGFESTNGVRVYDVAADRLLWDYPVSHLGALQVADIQGLPTPEVIYGDAEYGEIHVLNAAGLLQFSMPNCAAGVTNFVAGDADGDGVREVLWGAGYDTTGLDFLCAMNPGTQELEWRSLSLYPSVGGLKAGDVDADGEVEFVVTSSDYAAPGRYLVFDGRTKELEYFSEGETAISLGGVFRSELVNTDTDPQLEICTTRNTSIPSITCYDGLTHSEEWTLEALNHESFRSILAFDIDQDGNLELVVAAQPDDPFDDAFVVALNPTDGSLLWTSDSIPLTTNLYGLAGGNVDDDSTQEVVVFSGSGILAILDAATGSLEFSDSLQVDTLLLKDLDGEPGEEILLGRLGNIEVFDPSTQQTAVLAGPFPDGVGSLTYGTFAGEELWVRSTAQKLELYEALDAPPIAEVDFSAYDVRIFEAWATDLYQAPTDQRLIVGLGSALAEIGADGVVIFANGFESGDTTGWTTGP
jgi:hypothetical protein